MLNNRNHTIDTLRTVATILVILLHISGRYVSFHINSTDYNINFWTTNIINSLTRSCVPIFVMISGYFLVENKDSKKTFFSKRASRILIPLLFWSLLYSIYVFSIDFFINDTISFKAILTNIYNGKPFYHLWYLFMLIGLYFIIPFLNKIVFSLNQNKIFYLSTFFLIIGAIITLYEYQTNKEFFFIFWHINYIGYFLYGYVCKKSVKINVILLSSIFVISSICTALFLFYDNKISNEANYYFYDYLSPFVLLASLSIFKLFCDMKLKQNFLSKIAKQSFGIFLIHAGVLDILNKIITHLKISEFEIPYILIPIKFIIVFFLSLILSKLISNIKYLKKTI